jgi:cell division protein FtsB
MFTAKEVAMKSLLFLFVLLFVTNIFLAILLWKQRIIQKDVRSIKKEIAELINMSTSFNEHIKMNLTDEKKAHLLLMTYQLREAVAKQQFSIHSKIIEETPHSHHISEGELTSMLSHEHVSIIEQYWSAYRSYLDSHWLNNKGQIKSVFRGHPDDLSSELGQLHYSSKLLVKQFDKWLTQLNSAHKPPFIRSN